MDYVYVTFKSVKGCKIKIKLRIIGEYSAEFIANQQKLKNENYVDDYQPFDFKKGLNLKHNCKREHTQYLLKHKIKT